MSLNNSTFVSGRGLAHAIRSAAPILIKKYIFSDFLIIQIGSLRFVNGRCALKPLTNLSQFVSKKLFRKIYNYVGVV